MTDRQITHATGCWGWGPRHYECAVMQVEQLASELQEWRNRAQDKTRLWRQAMDDLDAARSEVDRLRAELAVQNGELEVAQAEAQELREILRRLDRIHRGVDTWNGSAWADAWAKARAALSARVSRDGQ